jgi:hypothetical protein
MRVPSSCAIASDRASLFLVFLAQVSCCGSHGFFPGGGCMPYSSARVAPMDASAASSNHRDLRTTASSHSQHSDLQLKGSSSQEGTAIARRKRPLAVAAGFKYAEDMNGRPIVITPGNRRMPVHSSSSSQTSSPSSQPVNIPKPDISPTVLFTLDHDTEGPRQQLSFNASQSH